MGSSTSATPPADCPPMQAAQQGLFPPPFPGTSPTNQQGLSPATLQGLLPTNGTAPAVAPLMQVQQQGLSPAPWTGPSSTNAPSLATQPMEATEFQRFFEQSLKATLSSLEAKVIGAK